MSSSPSWLSSLLFALNLDQLFFVLKIAVKLVAIGNKKEAIPECKSTQIKPWPAPDPKAFPHGSKLLWGFWDSGEHNLPPFLKLCIASWRAKNPDWTVIILSDENFKQYVAADEIPSTFYSLKVQHRSDLLRVAVLVRYGGMYMDASTLCVKGLDDVLSSEHTPPLLLTAAVTLTNGVPFPNNALFIAREPNNPLLAEYLQRMIAYHENPARSVSELTHRKEFRKVSGAFGDDNLGVAKEAMLYCANLWLLSDLLWNDMEEYSKQCVRYLPHWRWSFGDLSDFSHEEAMKKNFSKEQTFKFWPLIGRFFRIAKAALRDDDQLLENVYKRVCVIKETSDACWQIEYTAEELMNSKSVYGRILRRALDPNVVDQASCDGLRCVSGELV